MHSNSHTDRSPSMPFYELMYLTTPEISEEELKEIYTRVAEKITTLDGKIRHEENWGKRKLAYPIEKQEYAGYRLSYFELPAEKLAEFERHLKEEPRIIRHLLLTSSEEDLARYQARVKELAAMAQTQEMRAESIVTPRREERIPERVVKRMEPTPVKTEEAPTKEKKRELTEAELDELLKKNLL
ncbi:MAG: 30S ribosomal protein S6 [Parcubacteria group bacterium]|nr:30S ribosomal protein S6 [Parcubacteria group bacterium]